jgi:hypothetical protein
VIEKQYNINVQNVFGLTKDFYVLTEKNIVGREIKKGLEPGMLCVEVFGSIPDSDATRLHNFIRTIYKSGVTYYYFRKVEKYAQLAS